MPTYEVLPRFTADLARLSPEQQRRFRRAVTGFVQDLRGGGHFRAGLRVKRLSGFPGIYELTWSMGTGPAGRATWQYGPALRAGTPHVIWRRVGTHRILSRP
ncbi:hypothetical protein [Streptomyces albidoflavus]|uniref:hypothetical protein n=1 Tax=Streptomyces albidoflavus TaxID=1886 RepID=UPI001436A584|nr:hypothetical protein [Streptomyces sp. S-2]WTE00989.1 hypothetical protein OG950_30885 [Streptomyces albidoflavus]